MIKEEKKEIIELVRYHFDKCYIELVDLQIAYIDKTLKYNNEIEYDLYYHKFGRYEIYVADTHRNVYYFEFYCKTGVVWEIEGTNNYAELHRIKRFIQKYIEEYSNNRDINKEIEYIKNDITTINECLESVPKGGNKNE